MNTQADVDKLASQLLLEPNSIVSSEVGIALSWRDSLQSQAAQNRADAIEGSLIKLIYSAELTRRQQALLEKLVIETKPLRAEESSPVVQMQSGRSVASFDRMSFGEISGSIAAICGGVTFGSLFGTIGMVFGLAVGIVVSFLAHKSRC